MSLAGSGSKERGATLTPATDSFDSLELFNFLQKEMEKIAFSRFTPCVDSQPVQKINFNLLCFKPFFFRLLLQHLIGTFIQSCQVIIPRVFAVLLWHFFEHRC